jgi:hypothetical protein
LADHSIDLRDLTALPLELSPELWVFLQPPSQSPIMVGRVEGLGHR